jgi:hypothetical protein
VPLVLALGRAFGESIDGLKERLDNLHMVLAFAVLALTMTIFFQSRLRRSRAKAAAVLAAEERRGAAVDPDSAPGADSEAAAPVEEPEARAASNGDSCANEAGWVRPVAPEGARRPANPGQPAPARRS